MEHALGVGHGTPHLSRSCVGYGLLKFISDSSSNDWTATEVLPPSADETPVVDADEDILQMLVAGARVMHNEADSLGDQDDGIELNQWGNPKKRFGNQSTSTPSSEKKHGDIQWLLGDNIQRYVHQEGTTYSCFVWRRQQLTEIGYPWYREHGSKVVRLFYVNFWVWRVYWYLIPVPLI